jgi:DNA-binding PadR family transcriptional regulator
MTLRHAALAALLDGDASGYELSKRFAVGVANFWSATPQQLYRELERLERDGLVAGRVVEQQRRPNKRVFALTDAGRDELHAFTTRPARPMAFRDDLVVKVQAVDAGDVEAVGKALAERLDRAQAKLDLYARLRANYLAGRSEEEYLRDSDRIGPYLTLMGGCMLEEQNIRWIRRVRKALDARAGAHRR